MRGMFAAMDTEERKRMLAELLNMCDGKLLGWVNGFVAPMLKRDPFGVLPNELCLRVNIFLYEICCGAMTVLTGMAIDSYLHR